MQGYTFSDFSLISDFSLCHPLKIVIEITFLEDISHDFKADFPYFQFV